MTPRGKPTSARERRLQRRIAKELRAVRPEAPPDLSWRVFALGGISYAVTSWYAATSVTSIDAEPSR